MIFVESILPSLIRILFVASFPFLFPSLIKLFGELSYAVVFSFCFITSFLGVVLPIKIRNKRYFFIPIQSFLFLLVNAIYHLIFNGLGLSSNLENLILFFWMGLSGYLADRTLEKDNNYKRYEDESYNQLVKDFLAPLGFYFIIPMSIVLPFFLIWVFISVFFKIG